MPSSRPPEERFWQYVEPMMDDVGCWLWTGALNKKGYGRLHLGGRSGRKVPAHRFSFELHYGPIDAALTIDHLCRNTSCVNPTHLEAVTVRENLWRRGGKEPTHCPSGHLLAGSNLYVWKKDGYRRCRTCRSRWLTQRSEQC